jgi:hypothetical protein
MSVIFKHETKFGEGIVRDCLQKREGEMFSGANVRGKRPGEMSWIRLHNSHYINTGI